MVSTQPAGLPRAAVPAAFDAGAFAYNREAVVACSGRPGFALARRAEPAIRPVIRRPAGRLWRDDLAYAERRHQPRSA